MHNPLLAQSTFLNNFVQRRAGLRVLGMGNNCQIKQLIQSRLGSKAVTKFSISDSTIVLLAQRLIGKALGFERPRLQRKVELPFHQA